MLASAALPGHPTAAPPDAKTRHAGEFAPPGVDVLSAVRHSDFPGESYEAYSSDHFWFQWRLAATVEWLRSLDIPIRQPLRVLEVGGGIGVLRTQIETATEWTVDLSDLHLEGLRAARPGRGRKLYYDVRDERAERVDSYDAAILFDVLEHIEAPLPFLRSVLRHLRPGGWLLINVPAIPSLYSSYDEGAGHFRRYGKDALLKEVAPLTADVLDVRYWGLGLVPLLALRWLLTRGRSGRDAVHAGLRPRGRFVHGALRGLMRFELSLLARPWIGSSLLLCARRRLSAA